MHGKSAKKGGEREKSRRMAGYSEREVAIRERDLAEEETARLRQIVQRKRKELKARMAEVVREEAERRRSLDERSTGRFIFSISKSDASSIGLYYSYYFVNGLNLKI